MKKTTIPIKGMHCRSCELLIEDELTQVSGVTNVEVSEKKACAVLYSHHPLKTSEIEQAVTQAGYAIGFNEKKPWLSTNMDDYTDVLYALVALLFLYFTVNALGLATVFSTNASNPSNLLTVFAIGLTAGLSTCMALIGGLVLGISASFSKKNLHASSLEKFTPHLFFSAGRIASYIVLGGIIGLAGSVFQLSGFSLGLMTLAVALVMLTMGLQLTNISPRLASLKFTIPSGIARMLGIKEKTNREYSHKNSALLGAATFFLPCGFTQAMQLYAISSGSFVSGAAIMGVFALGTTPGLLGIGGLTSVLKGVVAQKFFKFSGVAVIGLSIFNANNGLNLLGWNPMTANTNVLAAATNNTVPREGNIQIVNMTQNAYGYEPNSFTIAKGVPVKWIINSTDPNSCASSILSSKIGVRQNLHRGENVIEFTPKETGTIPFSCMMGMYRGSFTVVEETGNTQPSADTGEKTNSVLAKAGKELQTASSCESMSGCGCGNMKK